MQMPTQLRKHCEKHLLGVREQQLRPSGMKCPEIAWKLTKQNAMK